MRYTVCVSELYIVGTPIGNLGDITFRALETLKNVDIIAAEDTRHTLHLLSHFGIQKKLISCRAQNEKEAAARIIEALQENKKVAYASDAGTPAVSDPGAVLTSAVRNAGFKVIPIPGVSALTTLFSVAGEGGKTLIFEGFLSVKKGKRKKRLLELLETKSSFIFYESPYRLVKVLEDIADIDKERKLVVGRELTKLHEEIIEGTATEILEVFSARQKVLGEIAIFVAGHK